MRIISIIAVMIAALYLDSQAPSLSSASFCHIILTAGF